MRGGFDEGDRTAGLRHARLAVASDTDDAAAVAVGGIVIMLLDKDRETALSAIRRALSLNPSCAIALYQAAVVHAFAGHSAEAIAFAERALRLSPFDLLTFQAHQAQSMAAFHDARYEDSVLHAKWMVHANPNMGVNHISLALSLALAGTVG